MTKTEREIQEIRETLSAHFERIDSARADLKLTREGAEKIDEAIDQLKDLVLMIRSQVAVVESDFAGLTKRWDESDRRGWATYGLLFGASIGFGVNLVLLFLKH